MTITRYVRAFFQALAMTLRGETIATDFIGIVEDYVARNYRSRGPA